MKHVSMLAVVIGLTNLAMPSPTALRGAEPVQRDAQAEQLPDGQGAELVLDPQGFLSEVLGLDFSPDGRLIAAAGEKEVRIWDVESGELRATLRGERDRTAYGNCYAVAFSPNGRELVVGIYDHGKHGSLRVYDTDNWDEIKELVPGQGVPVRRLAFSRDGKYLASAGENGKIFLWDWPRRRHLSTIEPPDPKQPIYDLVGFPTDKPVLLTFGFAGPAIYSVPDGRQLGPQDDLPQEMQRWMGLVTSGQLEIPYGGKVKCGSLRLEENIWGFGGSGKEAGRSRYWAAAWSGVKGAPAATYEKHRWNITAMSFSTDGRLAASGDQFGEVHIWDPRTGKEKQRFRSLGRPVYEAAFDSSGENIVFGTTSSSGEAWGINSRGRADKIFNLPKRAISDFNEVPYANEVTKLGAYRIDKEWDGKNFYMEFLNASKRDGRYRVRTGCSPTTYTLLHSPHMNAQHPVVVGDSEGLLLCWDPKVDHRERRVFNGHTSFITAVSESPTNDLMVSASTDRTIRLWSLGDYKPVGDFDFLHLSDSVIEVVPGTSSEKAGVRVGDRILSLEGKTLTELERLKLAGKYPYRPGQKVRVKMERKGRPYDLDMTLVAGYDYEEPLLNVFTTEDGDWIIWTPQGYYDSSPGADRLIGFHLNRGPDKSARFYRAQQFRKQLYRPDIIDRILESGDIEESIRTANAELRRDDQEFDFRKSEEIRSHEPPRVQLVEPRDGSQVEAARVKVRATVSSQNKLPVREVTILVNGSPFKKVRPGQPDAKGQQSVSEEVELLPGKNRIAVIAANSASSSAPQEVEIAYRPQQSPPPGGIRPNLYVLAIGIAKYGNPDLSLAYSDKDAEEFVKIAQRQQNGILYDKVQTRLLTNEGASKAKILEGFDWLLSNVTQQDVAMIFISAHGFRDIRQNYFLATHEIDPDSLLATGIKWDQITGLLEDDFPPCRRLMFIDTCHSGGVTGRKGIFDPVHDLVAPEVGTIVFASSTPREESIEQPEWGHGAFTRAILDTIGSPDSDYPPPDGCLGVSELQKNIADRVKVLTKGQQHPVMERPSTLREFNLLQLVLQQ